MIPKLIPEGARQPWPLEPPCSNIDCRSVEGVIVKVSGQNTLRCAICDKYQNRNVPKSQTGEEQRHVKTREAIKPKQRARIILRAGSACELCHANDQLLHAGHMLSLKDGLALGATEEELNDDYNLAALCEACNLGMASESFSPLMWVRLLRARIRIAK